MVPTALAGPVFSFWLPRAHTKLRNFEPSEEEASTPQHTMDSVVRQEADHMKTRTSAPEDGTIESSMG